MAFLQYVLEEFTRSKHVFSKKHFPNGHAASQEMVKKHQRSLLPWN